MKKIISLFVSLALVAAPAAAFAQTVTTSATVTAGVQTSAGTKAKARADQEIQRRVTNLNQLTTRTSAMTRLSDSEKAALQASLSAQVSTLTALQAKIDADTDLPTLKTDVQSITKNYRVYMLVLPQARIAASADRVSTIVGQMQTLGMKLEARITASTSTNVTALQAAYTDMQAKVADATTQANAAVSATASLSPDNGDATIAASNTAAVKAARADIQTATADLKAARADISTVLQGLKVSATASASATAN
jgi:hypothetical protein